MESSDIIQLSVLWLIAILAYWHRDRWLYGLAGFSFIYYGFTHYEELSYMAVLLVFAGIYCFIKLAYDGRNKAK